MNLRSHARSVILSHAVNEAFRRGLFDPYAPDRSPETPRKSVLFSMSLDQTIPMRVWLSDWYLAEARVAAALWPTDDVDSWLHAVNADEFAGEVFATGYLNRGSHIWLESDDDPVIHISPSRRETLRKLAQPGIVDDDLQLFRRHQSNVVFG